MKKSLLLSVAVLSAFSVSANVNSAAYKVTAIGDVPYQVASDSKAQLASKVSMKVKKGDVISSSKLKSGAVLNVVKGEDGLLHKVISLPEAKSQMSTTFREHQKAALPIFKVDGTAALDEGFEGWDGSTRDWIPSGWQDVSKTNPPHSLTDPEGLNFTWEAFGAGVYAQPFQGNAFARVQVALPQEGQPAEQQDEWLITPAVAVSEGDNLSFYLSYSPAWTLIDMDALSTSMQFNFTSQNNILEVQISTDNGGNWSKVWDVTEDLDNYTEDELMEDLMASSHPYIPVIVDLSSYVGKTIQVAFRYVGIDGESMGIDNVKIGELVPEASYSKPAGIFNVGFSNEMNYLVNKDTKEPMYFCLAPVYTPLTWKNTSSLCERAEWEVADPEDVNTSLFFEDYDLVAPGYGYSSIGFPSLTAYYGDASSSYKKDNYFLQNGGSLSPNDICAYDMEAAVNGTSTVTSNGYYFGFYSNVLDDWKSAFKPSEASSIESFVGFGNFYSAPAAPYALSYVTCMLNIDKVNTSTVLKATVYEITDEGAIGEELASGTCAANEIVSLGDGKLSYAVFNLERQQGMFTSPVTLTIDRPIFVEITISGNTDDKILIPFCYQQSGASEDAGSVAVFMMNGEKAFVYTTGLTFSGGYVFNGMLMSLGAEFTWLRSDADIFTAPVSGGEKSFTVESYYASSAWTVEGDAVVGNSDNAWIDWAAEDGVVEEQGQQYYTGETTLVLTADPLPAGVTGRSAEVTVSIPGASKTFYVQQGEAGVEAVETSANRVSVVNGNFEVEAAGATSVDVYNVAGQKVASAAIEGTTVVPAQDLAKGLYILKFNDNTAVKVMK